jgi:hypothetical protein
MSDAAQGVLVADVVQSSIRADFRKLLGQKLRTVTNRHLRQKLIKLPYSVTAGDEFQTVVENLPQIPKLILDLRANMRPLSIRVGIGIGGISDKIQPPVNRLSGEAFLKARDAIDIVKKGSLYKFDVLTAFQSNDELFDETINLIYGLQDTLVRNITSKQWKTIHAALDEPTKQEDIAEELNLNVSTVSRNLRRGYYWQLAETARIAGSIIQKTFPNLHVKVQNP